MDPDSREMLTDFRRFAFVGIEMGLSVAIGYWIGSYLDGWWGTTPYMTYFWSVAGLGAAAKAVYDVYKRAKGKMEGETPGDSHSG